MKARTCKDKGRTISYLLLGLLYQLGNNASSYSNAFSRFIVAALLVLERELVGRGSFVLKRLYPSL